MDWTPNKWIAVLLGFFFLPLGMLYIARPLLASIYLIAAFITGIANIWLSNQAPNLPVFFSFSPILMVACASHILLILKKEATLPYRPWLSRWYGLTSFSIILLAAIFSFRSFMYEPFSIPAASMSPTLNPGDFIIVSKWGYGNYGSYGLSTAKMPISQKLKRGDIIVFEFPKTPDINYVKRIIGLPGDTVEYSKGHLAVNDIKAKRELKTSMGEFNTYKEYLNDISYSIKTMPNRPSSHGRITVPEGHIFVLGDSRDNSNDSRYWGFVPLENIVGKLAYVF